MCGIAGIVGGDAHPSKLDAMLGVQAHRGPDHTGTWIKEQEVALGHNRLSILDLSEAANQPFRSPDGRFTLVFNGEIYNYLEIKRSLGPDVTFRTHSDTEVLLFAFIKWGKDCLSQLNGMFAFAIWDEEEKVLFAARDRFGVKPFHYAILNDTFYFSSEIQPLWKAGIPRRSNDRVWAGFFSRGLYGEPSETFWAGINQLPGGHFLTFQQNQLQVYPWYDFLESLLHQPEISSGDQEEYILNLMKDSIRLRFRADVPVGFNLSGGLDSSTILALVSEIFPDNKQIEAFSFITQDERYDEIFWVKKMLEGKPYLLNTCVLLAEEVPEMTRRISELQSEPFGGIPTLAYAKVFQKAREKGILVLLDGQGSDEAWAGYDYFLKKSNDVVQGVTSSPLKPEALERSFLEKSEAQPFPEPFRDKLLNLQYRDLFYTKIPRALRFNDRVSMAFGTELREPFLDFRLVEYVFSRPENFKIRDGKQKWLLRKISNKILGEDLALAPKRPLQTPQREWLGGPLREWTDSKIQVLLQKTNWFDPKEVRRIWQDYQRGNQDNSFYLWQWINAAELLE